MALGHVKHLNFTKRGRLAGVEQAGLNVDQKWGWIAPESHSEALSERLAGANLDGASGVPKTACFGNLDEFGRPPLRGSAVVTGSRKAVAMHVFYGGHAAFLGACCAPFLIMERFLGPYRSWVLVVCVTAFRRGQSTAGPWIP